MNSAIRFTRAARLWSARLLAAVFMHTPYMPPALLLVWLEWLIESMHPLHPCLPTVLAEKASVEDRCNA